PHARSATSARRRDGWCSSIGSGTPLSATRDSCAACSTCCSRVSGAIPDLDGTHTRSRFRPPKMAPMRALTKVVLRHRAVVLGVWLLLFAFGGYAASNLGSLLSNQFTVPGSPSQQGLDLLRTKFHQRSDGAFTLVVKSTGGPLNPLAVE